jgi:glycosyltransferase involved in cell wall biosynthesis
MTKPLIGSSDRSARALFVQGNEALRTGDYRKAITRYAQVLAQKSELPKYLPVNLSIARQKYRQNRQAVKKSNVGVCGWDLGHNAAGRVYTLATLYETFASVEIIGSLFPIHGRDIWEPIRSTTIAKNAFIVEDESKFIEQSLKIVVEHPFDIVHLSKLRVPNIFFGIMYKLLWDAKVMIEIDDEELAFVDEETPISIDSYLDRYGKLPEFKNLAGIDWTRLAVGCAHEFDGITVASHALQQRYGGQVIRHARNEMDFQSIPEKRQSTRARFGIAPDTKVVLFLGTPRVYKGLIETAQAIAKLKRRDIVFAIVGDFPDDSFKAQLQAIKNIKYVFISNQPISAVPEIIAIGDVCVLMQDTESSAALYQTPAKLSDALVSGPPVLATETPALADIFLAGALLLVNQDTFAEQLAKVLNDANIAQTLRQKGLDFFRRELFFAANVPRLRQVVQKCVKQPLSNYTDVLGSSTSVMGYSPPIGASPKHRGSLLLGRVLTMSRQAIKRRFILNPRAV